MKPCVCVTEVVFVRLALIMWWWWLQDRLQYMIYRQGVNSGPKHCRRGEEEKHRQLGGKRVLTGYCFKYIDRPFCLQTNNTKLSET